MNEALTADSLRAALLPGAPCVLTASNGRRPIREAADETVAAGAFDPPTLVSWRAVARQDADGPCRVPARVLVPAHERACVPRELTLLCRTAGFAAEDVWGGAAGLAVEHVWGGAAGSWGRRPVRLAEHEITAVMRRPAA